MRDNMYSKTQNFRDIERMFKMSYSKPTEDVMLQMFSFIVKKLHEAFYNCSRIFYSNLFILHLPKFRYKYLNAIEKLSRQHFIDSFDVSLSSRLNCVYQAVLKIFLE